MAVFKASDFPGRFMIWMRNHPTATDMMIIVIISVLVGVGSYVVGMLSIR